MWNTKLRIPGNLLSLLSCSHDQNKTTRLFRFKDIADTGNLYAAFYVDDDLLYCVSYESN
ncbi:MAG: hypothetical protein DI535_20370 [Citrobacter freundii]|nr:MAG: hypothetical protein DI535_20370 [Citrobacter freundii]